MKRSENKYEMKGLPATVIRSLIIILIFLSNLHDVYSEIVLTGETTPFARIAAGYADDPLSFDPLCVYFDQNATYNFDSQYDALKLYNTDKNVTNFYSFGRDSSRLSINAMPLTEPGNISIRLGLKTDKDGYVIFLIKDITGSFYYNNFSITDVVTGITQELNNNLQYKVNLLAGDYQNRFFLNLSTLKTAVEVVTSEQEWFRIYSAQGILKTEINLPECDNGIMKIYNLAGENLFVYKIHHPGYHEFFPELDDGIYIITFISGQSRVSRKIYIHSR